eukprot:3943833-Heterocapsa_arctica.AAC.1
MGGVQCGNRNMVHLQEPTLSKMLYDRGGTYGDISPTMQRSDSGVYRHAEERETNWSRIGVKQ